MFTKVKQMVGGLVLFTTSLAVSASTLSVPTITPTCGIVNKLSAGSPNGNQFDIVAGDLLGLSQASAGVLVFIGVIALIVLFAFRKRSIAVTLILGGLAALTFSSAIVGFATSQGSGCSFFT
jgi:hypothetical protein